MTSTRLLPGLECLAGGVLSRGVCGSCADLSGRLSRGTAVLTVTLKVLSAAFLRSPGDAFESSQQDLALVIHWSLLSHRQISQMDELSEADDDSFNVA